MVRKPHFFANVRILSILFVRQSLWITPDLTAEEPILPAETLLVAITVLLTGSVPATARGSPPTARCRRTCRVPPSVVVGTLVGTLVSPSIVLTKWWGSSLDKVPFTRPKWNPRKLWRTCRLRILLAKVGPRLTQFAIRHFRDS